MSTAADELADRRGADRRREIVAAPRQHDIGDVLFALPRRRDRRLAAHPSRGPDVIVVTGYQDDIAFDFCKWNSGRIVGFEMNQSIFKSRRGLVRRMLVLHRALFALHARHEWKRRAVEGPSRSTRI